MKQQISAFPEAWRHGSHLWYFLFVLNGSTFHVLCNGCLIYRLLASSRLVRWRPSGCPGMLLTELETVPGCPLLEHANEEL
jgi:hypothetical protein